MFAKRKRIIQNDELQIFVPLNKTKQRWGVFERRQAFHSFCEQKRKQSAPLLGVTFFQGLSWMFDSPFASSVGQDAGMLFFFSCNLIGCRARLFCAACSHYGSGHVVLAALQETDQCVSNLDVNLHSSSQDPWRQLLHSRVFFMY